MTLIDPVLTHRATLYRFVEHWTDDGDVIKRWSPIRSNVPCLFTVPEMELDPTYSETLLKTAAILGQVLVRAKEDVREGDWLVFSRPVDLGKVRLVTGSPPLPGPHGVSHRRFGVRWTSGAVGSTI